MAASACHARTHLMLAGTQAKDWRDKVGEPQQLGNDGIAAANYPQDRLTALVVLRKEVHLFRPPLLP